MRKTISFVLVGISSLLLVACGGGDYTGQAKTPSGSSIMEGQDFKDVEADFKNNGFTNIKVSVKLTTSRKGYDIFAMVSLIRS